MNTARADLTVTNESSAKIVGAIHGVYGRNPQTTVTNASTIAAGSYGSVTKTVTVGGTNGIQLDYGGSVTNLSGGRIEGS